MHIIRRLPERFSGADLVVLRVDGNDLTEDVSDEICDVLENTLTAFYADCASQTKVFGVL